MDFRISHLDHIAIAVQDLERSASWYEDVLGLERIQVDNWGPWPIMMFAGRTGIALFPAKTSTPQELPAGDFLVAKHFAFYVDEANFQAAQKSFSERAIPFRFEDHFPYHSIYLRDPDGYEVELTCLMGQYPGK